MGIFQMFIFLSKTATSNQTKLVTTHLAKATIERIKVDAESYFTFEEVEVAKIKKIDKENCSGMNCDLFTMIVNDLSYEVEIEVSQDSAEKDLNLINVVVI